MKFKFKDSLLFKVSITCFMFAVVLVLLIAQTVYTIQDTAYKTQSELSVREISSQLRRVLENDGVDFLDLFHYYQKHAEDMRIEYEGNYSQEIPDWRERRKVFDKEFSKYYGKGVLYQDIDFEDMPSELQRLFAEYEWLYCQKIFNDTVESYSISWAWLAVEEDDAPYSLSYLMDPLSEDLWVDGKLYRALGSSFSDGTRDSHAKLWDTLEGKTTSGFDIYDNQYGKTYACYERLVLEGEVIGVVGVEIEVDNVNFNIVRTTLFAVAIIGLLVFLFFGLLIFVIQFKYLRKIVMLGKLADEYAISKDLNVTGKIRELTSTQDEISTLAFRFSNMIESITNYIDEVRTTKSELADERERVETLEKKSTTDSLTGIRNRTAYDEVVKDLNWDIEEGDACFGIAMIDLNYLKRVNDMYGHDKGNIMIKKCCRLVCEVFKHSPVFRIGGDEFVVVLNEHDYDCIDDLQGELSSRMQEYEQDVSLNRWEKVSAAFGYALYDSKLDQNAESVFKRADKAMYNNKVAMKATRD